MKESADDVLARPNIDIVMPSSPYASNERASLFRTQNHSGVDHIAVVTGYGFPKSKYKTKSSGLMPTLRIDRTGQSATRDSRAYRNVDLEYRVSYDDES